MVLNKYYKCLPSNLELKIKKFTKAMCYSCFLNKNGSCFVITNT